MYKPIIHDEAAFAGMREAGRLAAACLDMVTARITPGVTTGSLDRLCYDFLCDNKALPACVGYRGYRHATCISINHVVCHGIPGKRKLKEGDILNIDVTAILDGWHGDTSRMFAVGQSRVRAARLMETTFRAMWAGIRAVRPQATLFDIGAAIQRVAQREHFSVVYAFCGHGLGRAFHAEPNIMHFGELADRHGNILRAEDMPLEPGMFFTIEPMINAGKADTKLLADGWTAVTRDRSLSAQYEHSLGVTEDGCEVFTRSPAGYELPPL